MYKNILIAVDLVHPDQAKRLLERGRKLLDDGGSVKLLHVLEEVPAYALAALPRDLGEKRRAEATAELRRMADRLGADADVGVEVRAGPPSSKILESAAQGGCDLIMIASHNPGLSDYFIGSTASRVVRHAQSSVLVMR